MLKKFIGVANRKEEKQETRKQKDKEFEIQQIIGSQSGKKSPSML
jgi:hypothetical protein